MNTTYQRPEPFSVPDGGLATFLTATEGSWADDIEDTIPDVGIGAAKQAADHLAKFGRYEDEYMVHAAEGETVIPKEILDSNPRLKASLFRQMRNMGVDPERYVIGNELNSINPVTGQPEFFLKKLGKFLKKGFKKIITVFKKLAPVVLPFVLNLVAPGLGTATKGALGAGLGSLVQGKSLKESFNAALFGGALGALQGGLTSSDGFLKGATGSFKNTQDNIFKGGIFDSTKGGNIASAVQGNIEPVQATTEVPVENATLQDNALNKGIASTPEKNIFSRTLDKIMPKPVPTTEQLYNSDVYKLARANNITPDAALAQARKELTPSLFRQYGPALAATTGVMALTGGFDQKNPKVEGGIDTRQYPTVRVGMPMRPGQLENPYYPGYETGIAPQMAAQGGQMFPRRTGQIAGPGTGTSDDIPAMLSDGEFVMTADAVRGAGNGSRQQGVRRMYDMMRKFEGGAV